MARCAPANLEPSVHHRDSRLRPNVPWGLSVGIVLSLGSYEGQAKKLKAFGFDSVDLNRRFRSSRQSNWYAHPSNS